MADESWRNCEGTWDRLRWARRHRYPDATAKDFAEMIGVKPGTYNAYERAPGSSKWIKLDHEHAFAFAAKLRVRWEWLLKGEGIPWIQGTLADSPWDRARKAIEGATEDQAEAAADLLERLLGKTGTRG